MSGESVAAGPPRHSPASQPPGGGRMAGMPGQEVTSPLFRSQQDVALASERQLDGTVDQVRLTEHGPLVGDRGVIDAQATTLDLAAGLAR